MKLSVLLSIPILAATAVPASAATFILNDGNSTATISDINGATVWRVARGGLSVAASPDNIFISNYLFRIGSLSGERSIATGIGAPTLFEQTVNSVTFGASNEILSASQTWSLTGFEANSGRSILTKSVTFTNLSTSPLDLSVFDYSDYDIRFNPRAQADFATLVAPGAILTESTTMPVTIFSLVNALPDRHQIDGFFPLYRNLFLDSDGATTLTNMPALGQRFPDTPGDTAFAFQFNRTLAPGQSFSVSQVATLAPVPEPSTWAMMLLGFGLMGTVLRGSRKRRGAEMALLPAS